MVERQGPFLSVPLSMNPWGISEAMLRINNSFVWVIATVRRMHAGPALDQKETKCKEKHHIYTKRHVRKQRHEKRRKKPRKKRQVIDVDVAVLNARRTSQSIA
eukprot:GHVO01039592.1.p1 GENE.GHVO01039592.1~~GHVO01039592.1.p1  ORF type:complete len:103 (+),score=6.08 GHVO01039592.1:318-626(+)